MCIHNYAATFATPSSKPQSHSSAHKNSIRHAHKNCLFIMALSREEVFLNAHIIVPVSSNVLQTVEGSTFKFLASSAFERFSGSSIITGLAGLEDCC